MLLYPIISYDDFLQQPSSDYVHGAAKRSPTVPKNTMSQEQPSQLLDNAQIPVPKIKDGSITADTIQSWNTNKLGLRLGADAGSAATASLLVAPVITIIDQ